MEMHTGPSLLIVLEAAAGGERLETRPAGSVLETTSVGFVLTCAQQ